ncbi:hypothetical protein CF386_07370 [Paraphotobacterium marinum]|uniref:Uncharacterized protein n=1 Tax=Paraphotobacterium marinum TaxID=1755811 RepID=A0A220VF39_9GAMM|nr:hypothetical protein [Paraphotobacterium marinum]ASK78880.1 hypothetical protein CF386_07370 [Paraphotobacterium marinum]
MSFQGNDAGSSVDYIENLVVDDKGQIYVAGRVFGDHANYDSSLETNMLSGTGNIPVLSKYNYDGSLDWIMQPGHSGNSSDRGGARGVAVYGNYVFVAGYSLLSHYGDNSSTPYGDAGVLEGESDAFLEVYEIDSSSNTSTVTVPNTALKAALRFGTTQFESIRDIKVIEQGGDLKLYIVGTSEGQIDGFMNGSEDKINYVDASIDNDSNDYFDYFIAKYDVDLSNGVTLNADCALSVNDNTFDEEAFRMEIDSNGNMFVAGRTASGDNDNTRDGFIAKFNNNCEREWTSTFDTQQNNRENYVTDIVLSVNENRIYFTGLVKNGQMLNETEQASQSFGGTDYFVGAINTVNGDLIDLDQYGTNQNDSGQSITISSDNVIYTTVLVVDSGSLGGDNPQGSSVIHKFYDLSYDYNNTGLTGIPGPINNDNVPTNSEQDGDNCAFSDEADGTTGETDPFLVDCIPSLTGVGAGTDDGFDLDSDGDGVGDDDDDCPNTPIGSPVNDSGCTDTDGDGLPDNDECSTDSVNDYASLNDSGNYELLIYTGIPSIYETPITGYINGSKTKIITSDLSAQIIEISDDDIMLHDNYSSDGQLSDDKPNSQILASQLVVGTTTYPMTREIHSLARITAENLTTGESGYLYSIGVNNSTAGAFATSIILNEGDEVKLTALNSEWFTGQVNYAELIASEVSLPYCENDTDNDGIPDYLDPDSDNDGVGDGEDDFPNDPNEDTDSDGDGVGDNEDDFPDDENEHTDSDGDGVGDNEDDFPNDPNEDTDTDGDGVGNNEDTDDDGDGLADTDECSTDSINNYTSLNESGNYELLIYTGIPSIYETANSGYINGSKTKIITSDLSAQTIEISDDDIMLHDNFNTSGQLSDDNPNSQLLASELVIGSNSLSANQEIYSIARITAENLTTGESGYLYSLRINTTTGAFATSIILNEGDEVKLTAIGSEWFTGQVNYSELIASEVSLPSCENDTDNDGIPDYLDPDSDNDGVDDGVDSDPLDPNVSAIVAYFIEFEPGKYAYPLFETEDEVNAYIQTNNETGGAHTHTYTSDPSLTTWYMPNFAHEMDGSSSPVNTDLITYVEIPSDWDEDGILNDDDTDNDNDGVSDEDDAFPYDDSETTDTDGDGVGDNTDDFPTDENEHTDSDGDGVGDNEDDFPDDVNEDTDTDGDGIGNNEDTDDDGDGLADTSECTSGIEFSSADENGNFEFIVYGNIVENPVNTSEKQLFFDGSRTITLNNILSEVITVNDDDDMLHDDLSSVGQMEDNNSDTQRLVNATTITDFTANNNIYSIARSIVENETTGESGFIYSLRSPPSQNYIYASTIALSDSDVIKITSSNNESIQNPIFGIGQARYTDLIVSDGKNNCDIDTDNDGIPNYLDPDSDNDGVNDGDDFDPQNANISVEAPEFDVVNIANIPYVLVEGFNNIINSGCQAWENTTNNNLGIPDIPNVGTLLVNANSQYATLEGELANKWTNGDGVDAMVMSFFSTTTTYSVRLKLSDDSFTEQQQVLQNKVSQSINGTYISGCGTGANTMSYNNTTQLNYAEIEFSNFNIPDGLSVKGAEIISEGPDPEMPFFVITENAQWSGANVSD